jgi:bacteriorhodopsin
MTTEDVSQTSEYKYIYICVCVYFYLTYYMLIRMSHDRELRQRIEYIPDRLYYVRYLNAYTYMNMHIYIHVYVYISTEEC